MRLARCIDVKDAMNASLRSFSRSRIVNVRSTYTCNVTSKNTRKIYVTCAREMDYATLIVETF